MHEPQESAHVIIPIWGQHQLLDRHQGMLAALRVLHDVMGTPCTSKLSEDPLRAGEIT